MGSRHVNGNGNTSGRNRLGVLKERKKILQSLKHSRMEGLWSQESKTRGEGQISQNLKINRGLDDKDGGTHQMVLDRRWHGFIYFLKGQLDVRWRIACRKDRQE